MTANGQRSKFLKTINFLILSSAVCLTACLDNQAKPHAGYYFDSFNTFSSRWVNPAQGPISGNTDISIYGNGFTSGTSVSIGGRPCTSIQVQDQNQIDCKTPPGNSGFVDITLTNPNGTHVTMTAAFQYETPYSFTHRATQAPGNLLRPSSTHIRTPDLPVAPVARIDALTPIGGPNSGGTRLQVYGDHFRVGIEVAAVLGTQHFACTHILVHGPAHLECIMPSVNWVGTARIILRNRNEAWRHNLNANFTYVSSNSHPTSHNNRDHSIESGILPGTYVGTEAEMLRQNFEIRMTHNHWLDQIRFGGRNIDTYTVPSAMSRGYIIHKLEIAQALHVTQGTVLNETELQSLEFEQQELIFGATSAEVEVNNLASINPLFSARPISTEKQELLTHIRSQVEQRMNQLNAGAHTGYYVDPQHFNVDGAYVHPFDGRNGGDRQAFLDVMNSIRDNHEEAFISSVVHFATFFKENLSEARRGFLDTFTYLYATKQFPSEGVMISYLHFLLRCGHLH